MIIPATLERPRRYSIIIALAVCWPLLLVATCIFQLGNSRSVSKSIDGENLRQIIQSSLIHAMKHRDQLPHASDVWDYARKLAESSGLDNAGFWLTKSDFAVDYEAARAITVLTDRNDQTRTLNPAFRALALAYAVPLAQLNTSMPASTPVAWTRGLQPDGTWAIHSPYRGEGGHIVFLGGNIAYFKNLNAPEPQLLRFDGKGPAANILEALPPGTRISEYTPTPDEIAGLKWERLWRVFVRPIQDLRLLYVLLIIWTPMLLLGVARLIWKKGSPRRALPATIALTVTTIIMTYGFAAWLN